MDLRLRHIALFGGLSAVGMILIAMVVDTAGHGVALAVAVTAIAILVGSYVRVGLLVMRAYRDEDTRKLALHRRTRVHLPIMFGAPLVVMAAHPWGVASFAVAMGGLMLCQVVFLHWMIVAGLILRRRARTTPPR
jgi:hypothetical protein